MLRLKFNVSEKKGTITDAEQIRTASATKPITVEFRESLQIFALSSERNFELLLAILVSTLNYGPMW